ncbi:MAG: OmpA family protein, partial [Flavobacteriaceae bacterium]|nr:OmpA family protein [Flavobacteriaceae bacterium]
PNDLGNDEMLNFMAGLTPQYKLSNRLTLYGDVSVIGHARAQLPWDGATSISPTSRSGLDGVLINYSVGLSISLGKANTHADWYSVESDLKEQLQDAQQRVEKLEADLIDSDMDGVPDYLDREPNTTSGVAVDSKGVAVDVNNNGIPDELESSLDNRYASKDKIEAAAKSTSASGASMVKDLLNKGYLNVYFRFNSDKPELSSMETVNIIKQYMKENPSASAELIGYADELGNASYNKQLSERRAKFIYDVLTASGIDASRLSYTGGGVDSSVDKSSPYARQLVRRVTFRIK